MATDDSMSEKERAAYQGMARMNAHLAAFGSMLQNELMRAASYVSAEASLAIDGPISDEQYAVRMSHCSACEHLDAPPRTVESTGTVGFCKRCGCGRNGRAELSIKGRMPKATCPLGKWPSLDAPPPTDTARDPGDEHQV